MRKEMILVIAAFFLTSMTAITGVYANDEGRIFTLKEQQEDITGDGIKDMISLKGVPYKNAVNDFKKIYIEVNASNHKIYRFPLDGGSKATVSLADINHDGVKDLIASVQTEAGEGSKANFAFSLKDFSKTNLSLPDPVAADGQYENGFKAQLTIKESGQKYLFDLKDRQHYYKKLGLFYRGRLNEPTELTINPYHTLKPFHFGPDQMGLVGSQKVTGISSADTIAYIKSYWLYDQGKWQCKNTVVQMKGEKTQGK